MSWVAATYFVAKSLYGFYEGLTGTSIDVFDHVNDSHLCLAFAGWNIEKRQFINYPIKLSLSKSDISLGK